MFINLATLALAGGLLTGSMAAPHHTKHTSLHTTSTTTPIKASLSIDPAGAAWTSTHPLGDYLPEGNGAGSP